MASVNTKFYSAVPDPQPTLDSLQVVAKALKNNLEVLTQQRFPLAAGAVTFQDLLDIGLLDTIEPLALTQALLLRSFGYGPGAGGAVTQAASKSTGVTLDKMCGAIEMNNAALSGATSVGFTVTNGKVLARDVVVVTIASAATVLSYFVGVDAVADGSFKIHLRNITAGSLSEAVVLNFFVLKSGVA